MKAVAEECTGMAEIPVVEGDAAVPLGTAEDHSAPRVLSIQSHVVHGYVGNKCATFPLQLQGFEVDAINSVQFSNNTAYQKWGGEKMTGQQVWDIFEGLTHNGLTGYDSILTGYIGSEDVLRTVVRVVKEVRKLNAERGVPTPYYCDPVMGDNGKCYLPEALVEIYRTEVLPVATVITPNQFECELLTGIKIKNAADVERTFQYFHSLGVATVVITSLDSLEAPPFDNPDIIYMIGSDISTWRNSTRPKCPVKVGQSGAAGNALELPSPAQRFVMECQRLPAYFTGTGDLTTALLLAHLTKLNRLSQALERTCASIQAVLSRTWRGGTNSDLETHGVMELKLIQSVADILTPKVVQKCYPFEVASSSAEGNAGPAEAGGTSSDTPTS